MGPHRAMPGPSDYEPHYDWSPVLRAQVKKVLAAQGLEAARKFLLEKGVHGSSESFTFTSLNDLVDIDIRLGHIDEAYSLLADRIKSGGVDGEMLARASAVACMKGELYQGQRANVRMILHGTDRDWLPPSDRRFHQLSEIKQVLLESFTTIAIQDDIDYNRALAAFYYKRVLEIDPDDVECGLGYASCIRADDVQNQDKAYNYRFLGTPEENRRFALHELDRIRSQPMDDNSRREMNCGFPWLRSPSGVLGTRTPASP
jgi:hypothetical protein